MAETFRQLLRDVPREFPIFRIGKVELFPVAVLVAASVVVHAQRLRIFLRKPCGRRGRGRADNRIDVVLGCGSDGVVEPIEVVLAFFGLHAAPGKLRDTNHVNAGLLHQREIGVPARFRPLFGIPGRAE